MTQHKATKYQRVQERKMHDGMAAPGAETESKGLCLLRSSELVTLMGHGLVFFLLPTASPLVPVLAPT